MRNKILAFLLAMASVTPAAQAATLWVGVSPACSGSSVYSNLDQALLTAFLNGDSTDEIRLTRTITYTGNGNGSYTLNDWSSTGPGALTIAGGYSDCFVAANGQTRIGDTNAPIFSIGTSSQQFSQVTLRDLLLSNSAQRAITANQGALVALQRVEVSGNNGGISVGADALVTVDANSLIQLNDHSGSNGGGISCAGNNSSVQLSGIMSANRATTNGGNLYVGAGCYAEVLDGVRIIGGGQTAAYGAQNGAGIHVASNGQLHAKGRANRVIIEQHRGVYGAGLYVDGGLAILENVHFDSNAGDSREGAAIALFNNAQLFMDRTSDCPLGGLRCSEIQNTIHKGIVVGVVNSFAQIQRTLIERSVYNDPNVVATGLVAGRGSTVRLNRVGIIDNEMYAAVSTGPGQFDLSHLTIAGNRHPTSGANFSFVNRGNSGTNLRIENSLLDDTRGTDWSGGTFTGKCNLIDTTANIISPEVWPAGSFSIGAPSFVNLAGNDPHQVASSDGVDMCQRDTFAWSTEVDLDMQSAPVNESTNPQGLPGETGGMYDAGFDEVYANVGEDEFTLTVQKSGLGTGVVISNPSGISCGSDCSEIYFNGTVVTLNAAPTGGSSFAGWFNCPLVNTEGQCLVAMTTSQTVRADFETDVLFRDGFD